MAAIVPYRATTISNNFAVLAWDKSNKRLIVNHFYFGKKRKHGTMVSRDRWRENDKNYRIICNLENIF